MCCNNAIVFVGARHRNNGMGTIRENLLQYLDSKIQVNTQHHEAFISLGTLIF